MHLKLYKILQVQKEFILSKQILRNKTNIGENINEALAGISKKARDSLYCLELLKKARWLN